MKKGVNQLAGKLLTQIHTAATLKRISDTLEELAQNKGFKEHASNIATDPNLTDSQKKTQLLYLIRSIEIPTLYTFFSEYIDQQNFWLFSGGRIDYFDRFVQEFQRLTESAEIVNLQTAIDLDPLTLEKIAKDLGDSFGIKVIINHQRAEHILGGVKLKIENVVYDYSLHTRFLQFQEAWIKTLQDTESLIGRNIPE